jgi:fructose-1,6-bisphosphatase/inositol monophosphatase family enzyme
MTNTSIIIQQLFEQMFDEADIVLTSFTLENNLSIEQKADKTFVTACDEKVDFVLSNLAKEAGFDVISEEGDKSIDIVKSGNYLTIDPIDGTLAYLEHVNKALEQGDITNFLKSDLGINWDFCLLVGVVQDGKAVYGGVFNYVTKERMFFDAKNEKIVRKGERRNFIDKKAIFVDQRSSGVLEEQLKLNSLSAEVFTMASFGLRAIYSCLEFEDAVALHRVQTTGLWDILPAAVIAHFNNAKIYDEIGNELLFNQYISLPGNGALIIKGHEFEYILEDLKKEHES